MDDSGQVDAVYTDYSKVFDRIEHNKSYIWLEFEVIYKGSLFLMSKTDPSL